MIFSENRKSTFPDHALVATIDPAQCRSVWGSNPGPHHAATVPRARVHANEWDTVPATVPATPAAAPVSGRGSGRERSGAESDASGESADGFAQHLTSPWLGFVFTELSFGRLRPRFGSGFEF